MNKGDKLSDNQLSEDEQLSEEDELSEEKCPEKSCRKRLKIRKAESIMYCDNTKHKLREWTIINHKRGDEIDLQDKRPAKKEKEKEKDTTEGKTVVHKRKFDTMMIAEQITTMNTILDKLPPNFTPNTYYSFPYIPLAKSTKRERFEFQDDIIKAMFRQCSLDLHAFITKKYGIKTLLHIFGPPGVGKSFSLYQVVCSLHKIANNRVIFVHDCAGWASYVKGPVQYLMNAVICTFSKDVEVMNKIENLSLEPQDCLEFLDWLPHYCKKNNLKLYAIFDQHNSLTDHQRGQFPFNLVETTLPSSESWKNSSIIVISASANNEYHLRVTSDCYTQFLINRGFNEMEFNSWVEENDFFKGEDFDDIKYWTSCIPIELSVILEIKKELPNQPIQAILHAYLEKKHTEISVQQRMFINNHIFGKGDLALSYAINAATYMYLNLSTSERTLIFTLNQQLMFNEGGFIYAITPIAKNIIYNSFEKDIADNSLLTIQIIFKAPVLQYSADIKGRMLEKYIIMQIETLCFFNFTASKVNTKDDPLNWPTEDFKFKNLSKVLIIGNSVPTVTKKEWEKPLLFVPTTTNYPDIDCAIWDGDTLLLAVQITILDPISKHSNNFFTLTNQAIAAEVWRQKSDGKIKDIRFLWIGINTKVSDAFDGQYIVTIDKLNSEIFPLLKNFNL